MAAEVAEPGPVAEPALPKRRIGLVFLVAVLAFAADLVTKIIVVSTLERHEPIPVLGGLVYFQLVRNGGAAFSIATGMTWILAIIAAAVVIAIIWLAGRLRSVGWAIGLGLVLAGAFGNLVDRIFRAPSPFQGHVVDFVSVFAPNGEAWPIFNVADSCICVGGVLIVLLSLLGKEYDGRSTKDSKSPGKTTVKAEENQ
ncbi:MAG TPA: signal peptidase II [Amycolatopsis sp.]|nr:signal peptidase II [Amycolatopsis sp.]